MLTLYHMDDPGLFFSTNDFWDVASDPTTDGADRPATVQLTSPLSAYVSVSSAPQSYGTSPCCGFPTNSQTLGPQQGQARFRSSAEVSRELNLLQAADTNVRFDNLLTLPTGDGTVIYAKPIYVERTNQNSFSQLNRVLVLYGDGVGYASSLAQALDEAVGSDVPDDQAQSQSTPPLVPGSDEQADPEMRQVVADSAAATAEARAAGDFPAAGAVLSNT